MTGGGAATNSGIDFQHRIGALALVAMLTDLADLDSFGLGEAGETPTQVRFETADGVDDLVVVVDKTRLLVQAKNTISLSTGEDSEFAKVVRQFVHQFRRGAPGERYVLAVSPGASGKIRVDLKKLCESHRLNESGVQENPLTDNERQVLATVNTHIDREFKNLTGSDCDPLVRAAILKRIYVQSFDVAEGGANERLALLALASVAATGPRLLWRNLVAICLSLARERLSIDAGGLKARVGALVVPPAANSIGTRETAIESRLEVSVEGGLAMGREVLLVRDDENRLLLVELRRFAEDGTKRVRFVHGHVELANGVRWRLLRRTSSIAGMTREITSSALVDEGAELIMMLGNLDDVENEPAALAHAEAARRRIEENGDLLTCLVCGRQISEHLSYTIESDDDSHPYEVGAVHRGCLRPMHRVLGVLGNDAFASNPLLFDFDFKTWVNSLKNGQGLFNSVRESGRTGLMTIQWNPDNASFTTGAYGVAYEVDDGTTHYVLARGKVQRMSRPQAERAAEEMNQAIDQARTAGDPWCANSYGFAPYSVIVTSQSPNPPSVTMASARELTRATVSAHNAVENYYAPLFYLADRESGQVFAIADAVPLLSDPLRLGEFLENWKHAKIVFPPHSTAIIADDRGFDLFMREVQQDSMIALIDPVFDANRNLVGGFRVLNLHETVARATAADYK